MATMYQFLLQPANIYQVCYTSTELFKKNKPTTKTKTSKVPELYGRKFYSGYIILGLSWGQYGEKHKLDLLNQALW